MTVPHTDESRFSPSLEPPTTPSRSQTRGHRHADHTTEGRALGEARARPRASEAKTLSTPCGDQRNASAGQGLPLCPPPAHTSTHEGPACSGRPPSRGQGAQRTRTQPSRSAEPAEGDALAREGREADPEVRRARGRPPGEEERHGQAGLREGHGRGDETGDSASECSKQIAREKKNEKNG